MPYPKVDNTRLLYLDSARGLAALSVMTWHFLIMFIPRDNAVLLKNPLHLFYYGESDIIFFFIHSGFILSYSYAYKLTLHRPVTYLQFLNERLFRIFPLFLFLLVLSFFAQKFFYGFLHPDNITVHSKRLWQLPVHVVDLFKQALLVILPESQSNKRLLPQDWTLSVELIVGALLPFLIVAIRRNVWMFIILFLLLWQFVNTYVFEFGIGVLLFYFKNEIREYWKGINTFYKAVLFCISLLLYSCLFQFGSLFSPENIAFSYSVDRLLVNAGCGLFFIFLISAEKMQNILSHPWLVKIGRTCYSLYLWHMLLLILFAAKVYAYTLRVVQYRVLAILITFVLFIISTVSLSFFSFRFIEAPFNKIGKKISYTLNRFNPLRATERNLMQAKH